MFDGFGWQALIKEWIDQVPMYWDLIQTGTHGIVGILAGVGLSMWALVGLYNRGTKQGQGE